MKVDAGMGHLHAERARSASGARSASSSFEARSAASQAGGVKQGDGVKQMDFTSLTRQEMRDWVNARIRGGEMSLDESRPFMAMTMKIPAEGAAVAEVESDGKRHDFAQLAREGIQGALSRGDEATLKMLQSAMSIMQSQQGRAIGIDSRA